MDEMKSSDPTVSIIMSVLNGETYLRDAIDSILRQTYRSIELVVVDDGSTDATADIIKSYGDPRIVSIRNAKNVGLARSLNIGVHAARGTLIARQDADDVSEPGRIERQVGFLQAHPEVALLGTWYTEIGGERPRQRRLPCDYTAIRWALLFYCPFVHSSVMWRRALITSRVGGYNESLRYSMDFELWTRIARSFPVANLDEYLLRLRLHPQSMTTNFGDHTLEGHQLRVAQVARMLRWSDQRIGEAEYEGRYRAIDALVSGSAGAVPPESALVDLLLLQQLFCEEAGLQDAECDDHRTMLLRQTVSNLIKLASREQAETGNLRRVLRLIGTASKLWAQARLLPARHYSARGSDIIENG